MDDYAHNAAITQIDTLGSYAMSVSASASQFYSVDTTGKVALWITSGVDQRALPSSSSSLSSSENGVTVDYGISPWSNVRLILSRVMGAGKISNAKSFFSAIPSSAFPVAGTIPGDDSTLLLGDPGGIVKKISRFGSPLSPSCLTLFENETIELNCSLRSDRNRSSASSSTFRENDEIYTASVTSVSVCSYSSPRNLVLIGRSNGVIDLYRLDSKVSLHSWDMSGLANARTQSRVVLLRWLPSSPSSFISATADGFVCIIDLLKDPYNPIASEFCNSKESSSADAIIADLSSPSIGGKTSYFVMAKSSLSSRSRESSLWVRKVVTKNSITDESNTSIQALCASMETWMARHDGHASITSKSDAQSSGDSDDYNYRK